MPICAPLIKFPLGLHHPTNLEPLLNSRVAQKWSCAVEKVSSPSRMRHKASLWGKRSEWIHVYTEQYVHIRLKHSVKFMLVSTPDRQAGRQTDRSHGEQKGNWIAIWILLPKSFVSQAFCSTSDHNWNFYVQKLAYPERFSWWIQSTVLARI